MCVYKAVSFLIDMSMGMQRNTLKRIKSFVLVKGRVRNMKKRKSIILFAWTAAATVCFGKCSL